ncbi:MAG TPA: O-antigen ligase family protein [Burkholderiales bacterium]|nr:O-antigen ligase family protein [Burkholderiales bacterium]
MRQLHAEQARFSMNLSVGRADLRFVPAIVFLFILPFTHTVALRLICLFAAALVALYCGWRLPRPPLPCKLPLLLWAGICALSLAWSIHPGYSAGELKNEVGYVMIAFLAFFYTTGTEAAWRWWRTTITVSCIIVSILALTFVTRSDDWPMNARFFPDRNMFSTYVVLVTPLFLVTLAQNGIKPLIGTLAAVAVPLTLACGYLTLNRAMWPALVVEIILFFWLVSRKTPSGGRSRLTGALALAVVCAIFAAAFLAADYMKVGPGVTGPNAFEKSVKQSLRPRIWSYAAERIAQRPITGYGFGRGILHRDFQAHSGTPVIRHAHNMVLNYALEAGLPGALLLLLLFATLIRAFWVLYAAAPREVWSIGAFGLTLLAGAAVKSMTDDIIIRENSLLFWSLIGMSLGYAGHKLAGIGGSPHSPSATTADHSAPPVPGCGDGGGPQYR